MHEANLVCERMVNRTRSASPLSPPNAKLSGSSPETQPNPGWSPRANGRPDCEPAESSQSRRPQVSPASLFPIAENAVEHKSKEVTFERQFTFRR